MKRLRLSLALAAMLGLAGQSLAQEIRQPASFQPGYAPSAFVQPSSASPPAQANIPQANVEQSIAAQASAGQRIKLPSSITKSSIAPSDFMPPGIAEQSIPQPAVVEPIGYTYDYYARQPIPSPSDVQPSPSDIVIPPNGTAPGGTYVYRRPLFTVGGWLNGGFTANTWNPVSNYNGTLSFNDRANEFQMNQMYLFLQRQTDTSDRVFDVGGRFDMLYGTDGRFTQATGLELDQNGMGGLNAGHRFYHLALPQMYTDVAVNNLLVRMGHWYSITGYETVTAPDNFFYSHAYTMQYGEPFTHTGVLTIYRMTNNLMLYNGLQNGWNNFNRNNAPPTFANHWGYTGGASWRSPGGLITMASTGTIGNENDGTGVFRQRTLSSNVLTARLTSNLLWVGQCDIGRQINGSLVTPGQDAEWYGLNQYFFLTVNERWRLGARVEWFRDDDGARVLAVGNGNPAATGGFAGDFYNISLGANWLPTRNFTLRPEIRWDWYDPAAAIAARPFNDDGVMGRNGSQFTAAFDGIWTW